MMAGIHENQPVHVDRKKVVIFNRLQGGGYDFDLFYVVKFPLENSVQLVPHSWVKEENGEIVCAWPPYRNITKLQNAIRNHEIPKSSWQWYAADIMKETYDYERGLEYEKEATYKSNLDTETEDTCTEKKKKGPKRKKIINCRNHDSSDEENIENIKSSLPPFPKIKKSTKQKAPTVQQNEYLSPIQSSSTNITTQPLAFLMPEISSPVATSPFTVSYNNSLHLPVATSSNNSHLLFASPSKNSHIPVDSLSNNSHIPVDSLSNNYHILVDSLSNNSHIPVTSSSNHSPHLPVAVSSFQSPLVQKDSLTDATSVRSKDESFHLRKIFRKLESMHSDLKDMMNGMKTKNSHPLPQLPAGCPKLPCENPEDLANLDSILQDESVFTSICNYLSTIGGSCVKDSTRRVLQQLMSNRLSLNYNWKGTRGIKLGFATFTHITKLILGAVRNNPSSALATEVEVNNVIKTWLMHAKDREGGRNARAIISNGGK